MRFLTIAGSMLLIASTAWSQQVPEIIATELGPLGDGWYGFSDLDFLLNAFLMLTLAAVLGATIAFHPRVIRTADTLREIEAPKVQITYAVIGALVGIMVVKYGYIVGFVLFGIGGLIRFRTVMRSPTLTGHTIFVTLIGLSCGLDLPHVAVLASVFGIILIFILDSRITYRIDVRELPSDRFAEAVAAYRAALEKNGYRILSEKKYPRRRRLRLIFRSAHHETTEHLEELLESQVDSSFQGSMDWEVD